MRPRIFEVDLPTLTLCDDAQIKDSGAKSESRFIPGLDACFWNGAWYSANTVTYKRAMFAHSTPPFSVFTKSGQTPANENGGRVVQPPEQLSLFN
jgi:hypothetical protein